MRDPAENVSLGKHIKVFIILICCILLSSGCSTLQQDHSQHPEESLISDQTSNKNSILFEADFDLLWEQLTKSYPYLPYLREQGVDVDSIHDRYAAELGSIDSDGKFAGMLQRMFSELHNFAHLGLVTPEMYQSYYYVYVLNDDIMPDELSAQYVKMLLDPGLSARYIAPDITQENQKTGVSSGFPEVAIHYYSDCRAIYMQIPSFAQEIVHRDSSLIEDVLTKYPEAEHIIFDITGNSGGSDQYWIENLVAPFGGSYTFNYRNFFRYSDIYEDYYSGLDAMPVSDLDDAPEWADLMDLDCYYVTRMVLPDEDKDIGAVPPCNNIKRWVLISPQVYSSSEKFASFCKDTGWATLVGRTTSGDGLGTTPVLILLPDSGMLIRFSFFVGENPDGSINAVRGTRPDEICIKGTLPLTRCLELIREEQQP